MSQFRNYGKSLLSMVLVLCLLLGMVPAVAAEPRAGAVPVGTASKLLDTVEEFNKNGGGTIELIADIDLTKPLKITSPIEITGHYDIAADNSEGQFITGAYVEGTSRELILVAETGELTLSGGVTIDAFHACRCIAVADGATLNLKDCTIRQGDGSFVLVIF